MQLLPILPGQVAASFCIFPEQDHRIWRLQSEEFHLILIARINWSTASGREAVVLIPYATKWPRFDEVLWVCDDRIVIEYQVGVHPKALCAE